MTRQSRVFNRVYAPKRVRAGANNRREGCRDGLSTQVFPFPRRNGRKKILGTCGRKERHRGAARGVNRGLTAPDPYQHSAETRSPESEARVRRAQPYARVPGRPSFHGEKEEPDENPKEPDLEKRAVDAYLVSRVCLNARDGFGDVPRAVLSHSFTSKFVLTVQRGAVGRVRLCRRGCWEPLFEASGPNSYAA